MSAAFLDTYALFEIVEGNKDYERMLARSRILTTKMNLLEFYYGLLKRNGKAVADFYYRQFAGYAEESTDVQIQMAAQFRLDKTGKRFSYVDCLGYAMAADLGLPFVTGDAAFEGLPNVEFVK